MYHYVRDSADTAFPRIRALHPEQFERQLDWLQTEYVVVDAARLEAAVHHGQALPPNAALLTFDDGLVDHAETVFPVLRRRRLSGMFFLTETACGSSPRLLNVHKAQFLLAHLGAEQFAGVVLRECAMVRRDAGADPGVFGAEPWEAADERAVKHLLNYELPFEEASRVLDRLFVEHVGDTSAFARGLYLGDEQIRAMAAAGMTFGYHTRTHRMLSRLSVDEQVDEIAPGVEWIRGLTGQPTVPFCYPWGGALTYTRETVRVLEQAGYSVAFNTVRRRLAIDVDGRFELPRFDTRDLPPHSDR